MPLIPAVADKLVIIQVGDYAPYVRLWDNSASNYVDYDAEAATMLGTAQPMWEQTADIMYWGNTAAFNNIGFGMLTSGVYGDLTWQYWNGAAWAAFTPIHNNTNNGISDFGQSGWIAWDTTDLASWAATTIDGTNAYWVRATVASVTTVAEFYNFMRTCILKPPLIVRPRYDKPRLYRDVDGINRKLDISYTGPTKLIVDCTLKALEMDDVNLCWDILNDRSQVCVLDPAQHATIDPDSDAYFKQYKGYITNISDDIASPSKMEGYAYQIEFDIEEVDTIL
ncbi:hypothetical protein AMJ86_01165 [bacterium SM23_57]|nr:MAG: hypothetical protein AMJ86_01165 [bacterium SM23_57]